MKKFVIYTRVASQSQIDTKMSISNQIRILQNVAAKNNLQVGKVITDVGSAISNRAGFNGMLNEINKGDFQGILCLSFDRLSRDILTTLRIIRLIENKKITILTPNEIYSGTPIDKFSLGIMSCLAQYYSNQISENVKRGLARKRAERIV